MDITEIYDNNFEAAANSGKRVLIDCYAPWCGSCKRLLPILGELSKESADTNFYKLNTDENPISAEKFDIMSIPTVLIFENGELKHRETGVKTKEELKEMLNF